VSDPRQGLRDARRVVVKVGSRSLAEGGGRFGEIAAEIAAARAGERTVVLVSSGAIALGVAKLGLEGRPRSIAKLQAAAAAGQSSLVRAWETAFEPHGVRVAQVLLTHADLADRDRYLNARAAIDALLELGAVPVINENDTVAVEEIRFGDNDQLAAMVATLVGADLLVLLTDVEGLLDDGGKRVTVVNDATAAEALVRPVTSDLGAGGMGSKIDAAGRATRRGVPVVIADARDPTILARVLAGGDVGTLFLPHGSRMASRKHWIAFTLKPRGAIVVDAGAAAAVATQKRSLLPAGVVGVRGDFEPGDAVQIIGPDGKEVGRGLARYSTRDVARLAGARTQDIELRIGRYGGDEIVHRDDMVVV
jgi:glutamate 5-kinase